MFAGTDTERSRDGLALPAGPCVEFDGVLYSETSVKRTPSDCAMFVND